MEWFLDREPGFPDSQLVTSCPVWSLWHSDSPVGTHQHHPPGGTHLQLPQHPPTPNAPPAWQRCPQSSRSHRILWCPHPSRTATGLGCCFIPQNSHRDSRGGAAPWGRYPSQADMTSVPVFPGKKRLQPGTSPCPRHSRSDQQYLNCSLGWGQRGQSSVFSLSFPNKSIFCECPALSGRKGAQEATNESQVAVPGGTQPCCTGSTQGLGDAASPLAPQEAEAGFEPPALSHSWVPLSLTFSPMSLN